MASDSTTSAPCRDGRIGQQLNPGGKLRLKTGDGDLRQLLLKRLHRLAVFPHRFHILAAYSAPADS
jgi:hypothetical protein